MNTLKTVLIMTVMGSLGCDDSTGASVNQEIVSLELGRPCDFNHDCESGACAHGQLVDGFPEWSAASVFTYRAPGYCTSLCDDGCLGGFECAGYGDPESEDPTALACLAVHVSVGDKCSRSAECDHECLSGECDGGPCYTRRCGEGLTCGSFAFDDDPIVLRCISTR